MHVVVRYHEIALKGGNRAFFVKKLVDNLKETTADIPGVEVRAVGSRIALQLASEAQWPLVKERVSRVFGVANFSPAQSLPRDLDVVKKAAVAAMTGRTGLTYRVTARRSDKTWPMLSMEIEREVGGAIHMATGLRVSLDNPDVVVWVEVLRDRIYLAAEKIAGAGGFPVGSSGKVMALLSGGIDSPVAAWRLMKRGCRVSFVHFHAFPLLDHTTIDKATELARLLTRWQLRSRMWLVPFGPAQQAVVASCPAPLRVVLYRRLMMRIGEALARKSGCKALVTGEALGQVASQTLDNMSVIDNAASGPVLRPLVGMDKDEITTEAIRIGTFHTSTLPDQDCCQLFVPRSPATAATLAEVRLAEESLDLEALIQAAVKGAELLRFRYPAEADSPPA